MLTITVGFFRSGHKLIDDVVIFTTSENYLLIISACRLVYATGETSKSSAVLTD